MTEKMSRTILVTRSSMPPFEEYCEEIRKLWDSHWLTNMGVEHQALEQALAERLDCPHVVLHTNGHLALEGILAAMRFPKGSEVITTPFTFASTTHAIARNGLIPVFCDVRPDDYTLDADKAEALITERTVAILPVHVYGNVCDVEGIQAVADRHGLKVIYDAAHAFAVKRRGVSVANFGDASMFSFHATKVFNTIEGGAVCVRDEALVPVLSELRNFGLRGTERAAFPGGNAKMSEFQAAMGLCNLRHLDGEIARRRAAAERYRARLGGVPGIRLCPVPGDVEGNYAYFPAVFDGYRATRDEVFASLAERGICARKYFHPLTSSFECYAGLPSAGADRTPVAAYLADRVLTLPLYADLAAEDVDRICETILSCGK